MPRIDYVNADPVADARRALVDSGHFHMLAVRVGDSVINPVDSTVLNERSYNVQVAPEGAIVFLPVDPAAGRRGWPSDAQLAYITRYNTAIFALLDTNALRARLPPN
jgi:hypothetical protein